MSKRIRSGVVVAALLLLSTAPMAFAQNQPANGGTTTGPAVGNDVRPNTAPPQTGTQKPNQTVIPPGDAGSGAPGVKAQPGTEGGKPAQAPATSQ